MLPYRLMILLPIGALLAACASGSQSDQHAQAQFQPDGLSPALVQSHKSSRNRESAAGRNVSSAYSEASIDPYATLALGAAYQDNSLVDRALPLPAATPIPAQAAQASSKIYQVFFDFNKSSLSPMARSIIRQAAEDAANAGSVQITLTGHADVVGTYAYNRAVAERSAASVAQEMEADGVPGAEIVSAGGGEIVPIMDDGIRSPADRRVEIVVKPAFPPAVPNS